MSLKFWNSTTYAKYHLFDIKCEVFELRRSMRLFWNRKSGWIKWLNSWVFVYELDGCEFESRCSHIRLYGSISEDTKTILNISSKTVHEVFTPKFICNYLYLLFIIFSIYLQSSTKIFSTTGTSYWTTGSSVNWIEGVTFVVKCPR